MKFRLQNFMLKFRRHKISSLLPVYNKLKSLYQNDNKTSPSTSAHFATRVRRSRVFSSELIFTFLYAVSSTQKFEPVIRLVYPTFFRNFRSSSNPTKQSKVVRSGELKELHLGENSELDTFSYEVSSHNNRCNYLPKY
jgi:hypothetical protein